MAVFRSPERYAIGPTLALFAFAAVLIVAAWWRLGAPVALGPPLPASAKIPCVSYSPFRAGQSPLVATTNVDPAQIEADLALLSKHTDCVRTYSVANGLDKVPEIARHYGIRVTQGLWLSSDAEANRI